MSYETAQLLTLNESDHLTPDSLEIVERSARHGRLKLGDREANWDDGDDEGEEEDGNEQRIGARGAVQLRRLSRVDRAVEVFYVIRQN